MRASHRAARTGPAGRYAPLLVLVAVLGLVGAGCSGPAGTPAGFHTCDDGFQCASIRVPVDHARPDGPGLDVAIVRKPAADPAGKRGVLLVDPGGPGASGVDAVEQGAVPPEIADHFDLVGFDPRGVGRSRPLRCGVGPETTYATDPDPHDPRAVAATSAAVDRYVASCARADPELLGHLGTRDVARDMDRIREFLGAPQLNYLGFSYGTSIGETYGQLFPGRVRAMVLDGVIDQSLPGMDPGQSAGFETVLGRFAASCAADPTCPIRPDAVAVVDRVRARARTAPPAGPDAAPLTTGRIEIGIVTALYNERNWRSLARALAAADAGDPRALDGLADTYFQGANTDTYNAVTCLDSAWPRTDAEVLDRARAAAAQEPHFSGNLLIAGLTCARWPAPAQPLTPPTGAGLAPTLVVGTTDDPATPYRNSVAVIARLPGSVLLTHRGAGHTAVGQGNGCVDGATERYLVDGTLPPAGTVC